MCSVPTFRKRSARNDHMETPSQQMHGGWLVAGPLPVLPFLSRWRRGNGICFGFDGGHNGQMDFPFLPACVGRAWSGQSHERKHLMDEASPSSWTGHTLSLGRQPGVRFCRAFVFVSPLPENRCLSISLKLLATDALTLNGSEASFAGREFQHAIALFDGGGNLTACKSCPSAWTRISLGSSSQSQF